MSTSQKAITGKHQKRAIGKVYTWQRGFCCINTMLKRKPCSIHVFHIIIILTRVSLFEDQKYMGKMIPSMCTVSLEVYERYYFRILLLHIKKAISFESAHSCRDYTISRYVNLFQNGIWIGEHWEKSKKKKKTYRIDLL